MILTREDIVKAGERIAPYALHTPTVPVPALDEALGCHVYLKLETLQRTGSFKFRGAVSRVMALREETRQRGLVAASSGNHGKALAAVAKMLGVPCTVVMPNTATELKKQAIRDLGARVVLCEVTERFALSEKIAGDTGGALVPPYNDLQVMAGQGTVGLEIMEDMDVTPDAVVVPVSGGGLLGGVAAAVKGASHVTKVYGAEPAAMNRYGESLKKGQIVTVPVAPHKADALVSNRPGDKCFPTVQTYADKVFPVSDAAMLRAQKMLLLEAKLLAEPSACIGLGGVLEGVIPVKKDDNICFVISGGSVSGESIRELLR